VGYMKAFYHKHADIRVFSRESAIKGGEVVSRGSPGRNRLSGGWERQGCSRR